MQFIHKPTIMGGHGGRIPIIYDADDNIVYYGDNGGNHSDIMDQAWGAKGYMDKKLMHKDLAFLAYQEGAGPSGIYTINGNVKPSVLNEIQQWCRQNLEFINYSKVADNPNTVLLSPDAAKHNALYGHGQAFGYVNGQLFFGINHSKITTAMIKAGWTYDQLMAAPQIWGWVAGTANLKRWPMGLQTSFGSDDKWLENYDNKSLQGEATNALYQWWAGTHLARRGARNWT